MYTMLLMAISGLVMAVVEDTTPAVNVPAALTTGYLVVTGLLTVRPAFPGWRRLSLVALVVALAVSVASFRFGFEALTSADGMLDGIPPYPFLLFGTVTLLAGVSDIRIVRSGIPPGTARLRRHLWRMCFALFIAAQAFFVGQADEFPEGLRSPALLAVPVLAVLLAMFYWLWRVRAPGSRASSRVEFDA